MKKIKLLNLPILIDKDEDNVWFAISPVLKWLNTQWYNLTVMITVHYNK